MPWSFEAHTAFLAALVAVSALATAAGAVLVLRRARSDRVSVLVADVQKLRERFETVLAGVERITVGFSETTEIVSRESQDFADGLRREWTAKQVELETLVEKLTGLDETLTRKRNQLAARQSREDRAQQQEAPQVDQWGLPLEPNARRAALDEMARRAARRGMQ